MIESQTDSTGWYCLTGPVGRYLLRIGSDCYYNRDRLVEGLGSADTLVLIEETRRIDPVGGAARLTIDVPSVPRDREITAGMKVRGTYSENPPPDTVWYPGTTDWNAAAVVRVEDGATVTGIDITMPE